MKKNKSNRNNKVLVANWENLKKTFIRYDHITKKDRLAFYMEQVLFGLHDFLKKHVGITEVLSPNELSKKFQNTIISKNPEKKLADVITELIEEIAPYAVNVSSPYFIGHMTSAIPFFMIHLKSIVAALNQNVVKLETSKVLSIIEKQVLAKIHRLIYKNDDNFYNTHVQNINTTLGCFVEDGTLANMTALWVARNKLFPPKENNFAGIEQEGLNEAYLAYDVKRCVILVSRLGHYSIIKAAGLLGIGNKNIISIDTDKSNKIDMNHLKNKIDEIKKDNNKTKIIAIVGIAGTTETGSIDPLVELGKLCAGNNIYFHIDAAWGGPTLMSEKYSHLLSGIELSDSVTIDGHKQFYMPMSCGMVYFKDPKALDLIEYSAKYVIRKGSMDLGKKSIAGSREANSLILDNAIKIMGSNGYALLIDHGIKLAKTFAKEIEKRKNFEIITQPELNILTYRLNPINIKVKNSKNNLNEKLNFINEKVQRFQRESGKSFVSRTNLRMHKNPTCEITVFRVVLMNPMTNINILKEILDEQENIYNNNLKLFI